MAVICVAGIVLSLTARCEARRAPPGNTDKQTRFWGVVHGMISFLFVAPAGWSENNLPRSQLLCGVSIGEWNVGRNSWRWRATRDLWGSQEPCPLISRHIFVLNLKKGAKIAAKMAPNFGAHFGIETWKSSSKIVTSVTWLWGVAKIRLQSMVSLWNSISAWCRLFNRRFWIHHKRGPFFWWRAGCYCARRVRWSSVNGR